MMTAIKSHLSTAELEWRYETAADPICKSHFHALWLLSKGLEIDEVAELLSFSTRWVYQLVRRYNEGGPDCLRDQRVNNGAEARILTAEALAALKERIKTPPDDGGLWTGPKVARWLAKFHDLKSVHDQRGWDALVGIEYSIQKPRPRHPEVEPTTGRTMWNVSNAVCKEMFEAVLADFAKSIGVGNKKRVVIQLDQAGWHGPQNLTVPDGVRLVFQPSHSPELQPAEHLWQFVDEPLANTYFDTIDRLDKVVGERCVALMEQRDPIHDRHIVPLVAPAGTMNRSAGVGITPRDRCRAPRARLLRA
jgi:transposase